MQLMPTTRKRVGMGVQEEAREPECRLGGAGAGTRGNHPVVTRSVGTARGLPVACLWSCAGLVCVLFLLVLEDSLRVDHFRNHVQLPDRVKENRNVRSGKEAKEKLAETPGGVCTSLTGLSVDRIVLVVVTMVVVTMVVVTMVVTCDAEYF